MTNISFEFFPPKTERSEVSLWSAIDALSSFEPDFVSVTYGAGGSTRARTHDCVERLITETSLTPAAHLTCVGASQTEVNEVIDTYQTAGVRHIVAIRGDMPDMGSFTAHPSGYPSAVSLTAACVLRGFEVSVSAYPERHPDSVSFTKDIDILRLKASAGACRAITQFCLNTDAYLRLRDRVVAAGLDISIVPGIMPTTHFPAVQKMAAKCGALVPSALIARYAPHLDDAVACRVLATDFATEQCMHLIAAGFPAIHFYTLNQAELTSTVCSRLTLGGQDALDA